MSTMSMTSALLAARFGTGLGPGAPGPASADAMLAPVSGPDRMAAAYPVAGYDFFQKNYVASKSYWDELRRKKPELTGADLAREVRKKFGLAAFERSAVLAHLARWVDAEDMLRERMQLFWTDHFTVVGRGSGLQQAVPCFISDTIRPHLSGYFADMLVAAVSHPIMLRYLDQGSSVAPGSRVGQNNSNRGLNENLAREVLELHTLGVEGGYAQSDVRDLATVLAGITMSLATGTGFNTHMAQPRPVRLFGVEYGMGRPSFAEVEAALRDIAAHPSTARHLSRKLAVHFVSPTPPDDLLRSMESAWTRTDGHLPTVYEALLSHPAALSPERAKIKQPFEFLASALKALGLSGADVMALDDATALARVMRPLRKMGQPLFRAPAPDGWPEEGGHWITPANLSARLDAMMGLLRGIEGLAGTDPERLMEDALGPLAGPDLRFAVGASESRQEAAALVLVSPAFQRR